VPCVVDGEPGRVHAEGPDPPGDVFDDPVHAAGLTLEGVADEVLGDALDAEALHGDRGARGDADDE
jgi:hypothetical protein